MGLDVYVMPLYRFKADDFLSPIEIATNIRHKIIVPGEVKSQRRGWFNWFRPTNQIDPTPETSTADFRKEVEAIRKATEEANNVSIDWNDEGDVVYSEQSLGFEALRAFAKWLDCRDQFAKFELPSEGNYYDHPVMAANVETLSCPHLVEHDCYSGYFLPCEFNQIVSVEPHLIFGQWPASRTVGSSPRLNRELENVQEVLKVPDDYCNPENDALAPVKIAYLQLRKVASLSCQHGLPIIFWG